MSERASDQTNFQQCPKSFLQSQQTRALIWKIYAKRREKSFTQQTAFQPQVAITSQTPNHQFKVAASVARI
jgi:hypothetical protein